MDFYCIHSIISHDRKSEDLMDWIKTVIERVEAHQTAVRISKTAAGTAGVIGTILCFTPLAPLGIATVVSPKFQFQFNCKESLCMFSMLLFRLIVLKILMI